MGRYPVLNTEDVRPNQGQYLLSRLVEYLDRAPLPPHLLQHRVFRH